MQRPSRTATTVLILAYAVASAAAQTGTQNWTPCTSTFTDPTMAAPPGTPSGLTAMCATATVPLDWSQTGGQTISLFMRKFFVAGTTITRQLYMIAGGPGDSGIDFEGLAAVMLALGPGVEIMIPDHRGTGRSENLYCEGLSVFPASSKQTFDDCKGNLTAKYGATGWTNFNTQQAASDLDFWVTSNKGTKKVIIYAVSYGTFLTQQFIGYKDSADEYILDGIAFPQFLDLLQYDYFTSVIFRKFMDACGTNEVCSKVFGSDPMSEFNNIVKRIPQNCPVELAQLLSPQVVQQFVGSTIPNVMLGVDSRIQILAIAARLKDCSNSESIKELNTAAAALLQPKPPAHAGVPPHLIRSDVVNAIIGTNELVGRTPFGTFSQEQSNFLQTRLPASIGLSMNVRKVLDWIRYPAGVAVPAIQQAWTRNARIYFLQGGMDPQTSTETVDIGLANYLRYPNASQVWFPYSGHGVLGRTNKGTTDATAGPCGFQVVMGLAVGLDISAATKCISTIYPIDFSGSQDGTLAMVKQMFGEQATLYGTLQPPPPTPPKCVVDDANSVEVPRDYISHLLLLSAAVVLAVVVFVA